MPVDYEKIREEYRVFDDPKLRRFVRQFVVDSYADRTHFIFELLQNAEDAIARRNDTCEGDRAVSFLLKHDLLQVSHFGDPFNEDDVRGICGIGDSTKDEDYTAIGRFGIGFKSVYSFTDRPEVHSGDENFVIENFVSPTGIEPIDRDPDQTVFLIPLDRESRVDDFDKIATSLAELGARSLLFLRHVDEIRWEVDGSDSGHYLREERKEGEFTRRINVIGHVTDLVGEESDVNEEWIVFAREVQHEGEAAGHVEIAFNVDTDTGKIRSLDESKLVVYFPTVVETHMGFLVQGPYRTTPNRDNVPPDDKWNMGLVQETTGLLSEVLVWLRDKNMLDVNVLESLPIRRYFDRRFEPLFDQTKTSLLNEKLLPRYGQGFVKGNVAALGRSDDMRALFTSSQLSEILGRQSDWLASGITSDRSHDVWSYLTEELGVREIRPEYLLRELTKSFLIDQTDEWIEQLYEFLADQRALHTQCKSLPLIRLEDGSHVCPQTDGHPNAYLPSDIEGFPVVKLEVCHSSSAVRFLEAMGINRPNVVDHVMTNVLHKYKNTRSSIDNGTYETDVKWIVKAYDGAHDIEQRRRLLDALSTTSWVMAKETVHGTKRRSRPRGVYFPTERLKTLFRSVSGIRFADNEHECLRNEEVQALLSACGTSSNLRSSEFENGDRFSNTEREGMRQRSHGDAGCTSDVSVMDWRLDRLETVLESMDELEPKEQIHFAGFLWDALRALESRYFEGEYRWHYYSNRSCPFDSYFVELLNETAWIPTAESELKRPGEVIFDDLHWTPDEFVQSKIKFMASDVEKFAKNHGVNPALLDQIVKRLASGELTEDDWNDAFPSKKVSKRQSYNGPNSASDVSATGEGRSYGESLLEAMTPVPTESRDVPVIMPSTGPRTSASAREDTLRSLRQGRSGSRVTREVTRFEPSAKARGLDDKFNAMLLVDYEHRCQICGKAFLNRSGDMQVFADHVVAPSEGAGTNHYGNLMSLCGWHYALISYGQWVLLDPLTEEPVKTGETDRELAELIVLLEKAETEWDNDGNEFITLPIRFWNVYSDWRAEAGQVDAEIRFSLPHRAYLVELLTT